MGNSENFDAYAEALFEGSLDCVKTLTLSGTLCRINGHGLCAMEIADASVILGKEWASVWPENEQAAARESVARAASGQAARFQGYCPTAAGTPKWWDVVVTPVCDANGAPTALLAISRDITDVAAAGQAIVVVDDRGVITGWNGQARSIFGWTADQAIGSALSELLIPARFRDAHFRGMSRFIAAGESTMMGKPHELWALRSSGEEFPIELVLSAIPGPLGMSIMASVQDISSRKAQSELFENAFQYAPLAKALVSPEGRFLKLNQAFCDLVGYDVDDLLELDFQTITHADDLSADLKHLERLIVGEITNYQMDKRYLRKNGSQVWANLSVSVVRYQSGAPRYFIAQVQDLTERREAEDRYRLLADNISDVVGLHDLQGRCVYMSPSSEQIFGRSPQEMIGTTPFNFTSEAAHADLRAAMAKLADEPLGIVHTHLMPILRKDGQQIWAEVSGRRIQGDAGEPLVVAVTRDVTARIESEKRFRLLAANATDIVTECDLDGRFRYVSPAVTSVTGYTKDEVVGKFALDFVHPDDRDRVEQEIGLALRSPGITQIEHRHIRKDGTLIWVQSRPRLAFDPVTGKPSSVTDVMRDITAQKAMETDLISARATAEEASQIKSDFLANMSHEIRTPLTAILGFSTLLTDRNDIPEDAQLHLGRIARAGQSLLSIVNDVLDFSKLEAGQYELRPEACDPLEVCHEALLMFAPLAQDKGIALDFDQSSDLPAHVELDPHRLRQILLNLVGNAIKFTDAGSVGMTVSYDTATEALAVSIRDSGVGMDDEQCSRLFQRFSQVDASSTRKHGGTGLGLAICKGLSEVMGGSISVNARPGQGSTFSFSVSAPVVEIAATVSISSEPRHGFDLDGLRLLVVDDNPANREIVSTLIGRLGVEVFEAEDGPQAISMARQLPFDVVLMDVRMPGMNGEEAARAIKREPGPNQSVPILGFSADIRVEMNALADFDGLVSKPIVLSQLIEAIVSSLCERSAPDSSAEAGAA